MSPAQNRRHKRLKDRTQKQSHLILPVLLLVVVAILIGIIYFFAKPRFWDGKSKMSMVTGDQREITVINFDPSLDQITAINIPGSTQVEVSRSLGTWRLGSVVKLGIDENLDGELLRETVVRNFSFPVVAWSDAHPDFYLDARLSKIINVFAPIKTNLSLVDRIRLFLFAMQVDSAKKTEINLAKTSMLKPTRLTDGSSGYSVTKLALHELIGVFANNFSGELLSVSIKDASGDNRIATSISNITDYLGAKVVSRLQGTPNSSDCSLVSKNKTLASELSEILGCSINVKNPDGNFDLEILIGGRFAARF